jgi:hypothetical protein
MAVRVSLQDVARQAGVSVSTVSLALSGQGRMAAATRERIVRCAAELGYVRNPVIASLAAGRFRHMGKPMVVAAWAPAGLPPGNHLEEQAPNMGMHIVSLSETDDDLADHIASIGAQGLVVTGRGLAQEMLITLTVPTVMWLDECPMRMATDVVDNFDWWVSTTGAIERVRAAGCRRPALVTIPSPVRHWHDDVRLGAARFAGVPVLEHDGNGDRLQAFVREICPDVVIGNVATVCHDLRRYGMDLPFVCLILMENGFSDGLAGWLPDDRQQSLISLQLIEERLRYGPRTPRRVTVAPRWCPGPSFQQKS